MQMLTVIYSKNHKRWYYFNSTLTFNRCDVTKFPEQQEQLFGSLSADIIADRQDLQILLYIT